jgi:general secretion pathway protein B
MSLILEALRKSEAERRRGLAPDMAMELPPPPVSRPRAMPTWLLPALLVAALLVLAGWWGRREPATPASTSTPPTAGDETDQTGPEPSPRMPAAMPRIEARPRTAAGLPASNLPTTSQQPPAQPTVAVAAPVNMAPRLTAFQPTPVPIQPLSAPAQARPLPVPAGDVSNDTSMLPPLKLSMLMWDEVPSKRFVILNGQRMAEGDHYGAISVVSIERGGVVVEGNGATARVPLP